MKWRFPKFAILRQAKKSSGSHELGRRIRKIFPTLERLDDRWLPSTSFAIKIESTTTSFIVNDGGPGDIDGLVNNQIVFQSGIGSPVIPGLNIQGESAFTNTPGVSTGSFISTSYFLSALSGTGGSVTVTTSATGFTQPAEYLNPLTLDSTFNGNGQGNGSISGQGWADTTNSLFGMGPNTPGKQGPFAIGAVGGYGGASSTTFNRGPDPFALTSQIVVSVGAGASTTGSILENVPAPIRAAIGDFIWHDLNANGIQDSGESGVAGATVKLFDSANVQVGASQVTAADGKYLFTGLNPGNYHVEVTPPAGYSFSPKDVGGDDAVDSDANPATGVMPTTTLDAGETDLTWDAGLYQPASLGDFVWHDLNANGVQDANEPGIPNATVNLKDAGGNVIASTMTDANGYYAFTNLTPGTYSVQFVQPGGYNSVSPLDAGGNDATDSDANPAMMLMTAQVTLTSGETNNTLDAGFYNTAALGDFVWHDLNANGVQDANEPGIPNATVNLKDAGGNVIASTMTDANGYYAFTDLTPGTYSVQFVQPGGYNSVSPLDAGGNDATDSDANPAMMLMTAQVTLTSGETNNTLDAGFYNKAALGDFVWHDLNANGVQDANEPGIPNATVNLKDAGGNVIASTMTDANGYYAFTNLTPGTYSVQFVQPGGYNSVSPLDAGGNDATDSDANPAMMLMTAQVTLTSGETNNTLDAGFFNTAALGDFVWHDLNANGVQDANEPGIPNATVNLKDAGGNVIASTMTDANGYYAFTNLTPGTYSVQFVQPGGYNSVSPLDAGGNDATDSDANPAMMLMTAQVTLTSGETNNTLDAGFFNTAAIGDFIWLDLNANGIQDGGAEVGVAGAVVELFDSSNVSKGSQTTTANGLYLFTNLTPGDYYVVVTPPVGYVLTLQDQGNNDALDSDANQNTGIMATTNLSSGETDLTWDAGLYQLAELGDFVWEDLNANGVQDKGEPGIYNVAVNLYDGSGNYLFSNTTDINGYYLFGGLTPGTYKVEFIAPNGYGFSPANVGNDAFDSDANTVTGVTGNYTLASGESNLTVDAGLFRQAALGDYVWIDLNADGIQDIDEPGVPNVTVNLLDASGNFIKSATTDSNGYYLFANLNPGTYQVEFIRPSGFVFTSANVGSDDLIDSDADRVTGRTSQSYTLVSNQVNLSVDAGLLIPAIDIEKYVYPTNQGGGAEGLTPGFWKQSQHFYAWTGYTQTDNYNAIFGVSDDPSLTLLGALQRGGGGFNALGRHAVAALLNAANLNVGYAFTTAQIITMVQNAYANPSTAEAVKNLFAQENEKGADLNTPAPGPMPIAGYGDDADFPTGPVVPVGNQVTFTYVVTNPSFVELANVVVTDDNETPLNTGDDFNPAPVLLGGFNIGDDDQDGRLDPGEVWIYTYTKTVVAGQHVNIAKVVGTPIDTNGNPLGVPVTDQDAAHWKGDSPTNGGLSGKKWRDLTGNGLTADDTPLGGIVIYLDTNNNGVKNTGEPSTTTLADGTFSFTNLAPGTYVVREVVPAGFIRTWPALSDKYTVSVTAGMNSGGNDFANFEMCEPGTLTSIQFTIQHINGSTEVVSSLNGHTQQGDLVTVRFNVTGNENEVVSLVSYTAPEPYFNANTASQQKVFEIATGTFAPGGPYYLTVHIPNCYYQIDFVCGPVINQLGPAGSNIFYTPQGRLYSADNGGVNACCNNPGSLRGIKFLDLDGDGYFDPGEPTLQGWTIYLDNNNNGVRDSNEPASVTDSKGAWVISNLASGTYRIREVGQTNWYQSANPGTTTSLANGQNKTGLNFGNYQKGSVSGFKFRDRNGDGIWDPNGLDNCAGNGDDETPLSNWRIFVDYNNNGVWDSNEPSDLTDSNGYYNIGNLNPGLARVREVMQSGWVRTTDDQDLTLTSGQNACNVNLGNFQGNLVMQGDTATIGFWHCNNGQNLIKLLNGSQNSCALGNWLASSFPKLYGNQSGSANNMTGKTNMQVRTYFQTLYAMSGQLEAQVMATALSVYVTKSSLAGGTYAATYGFTVNSNGVGADYYNIGNSGAAFGVTNGTALTVLDILNRTNSRASGGVLWGTYTGSQRTSMRNLAYSVFVGINEMGGITG